MVRSSIARRLGIDIGGETPVSRDIKGVVEMMLDATQNYSSEMTKESSQLKLFRGFSFRTLKLTILLQLLTSSYK